MQTFPIVDGRGVVFAVEVENAFIRPRVVAELLRGVSGVSSVRVGREVNASRDVRVAFVYHGRPFIVLEPYGDSSRYWIGPDDAEAEHLDIAPIEEALQRHRLSMAARIVGGIVSLRLGSLLHR